MDETIIRLDGVTWAWWNPDAPPNHAQRTVDDLNIVWDDLDLDFPSGITSVLGENGIGKSTLLLLAGGRLHPPKGTVTILGTDTATFRTAEDPESAEERRNRLVSFVYQNMELDTPLSLEAVLEEVVATGAWKDRPGLGDRGEALLDELPAALDLEGVWSRRLQELSKGELQRALIAMAACYGSPVIIMDEPTFAMEPRHRDMSFRWLSSFCEETATSLIYTAHDIDLCRDHARHMLLIGKDKSLLLGPVAEVCTRENLEEAYQVPMDTLYRKENLYRDMLRKGRHTEKTEG